MGAVIDRLLAIDLPIAREIIVVDDGSTDGTRAVLEAIARGGAPVTVILAPRNNGKGSAIRLGLQRATGTIVAIQDADLELDPQQLSMLVAPILAGEAHVVYGSRFLAGRPAAPWLTIAANRFLTGLTNLLYGSAITDMETCYKVMRTEVAQSLGLTANRFDIEPEITAKLLRAGHRIEERPVRFEPRTRSQGKKINWRDGVHATRVLWRHASMERAGGVAAGLLVALLAAGALAVGISEGTHAIGGSDASCYALQAQRFASGRFQVPDALALAAPWPSGAASFTPSGHLPSPTVPGASVPICPAGLSIVMAAFMVAGGRDAIFLVVPLFGALFVWSTWLLGRRFGAGVGLCSALVAGCSPPFLFQLVQPMSDVPAAALWALGLALAVGAQRAPGAIAAGFATSAAILVRPNLAPVGMVIGGFLLMRPNFPWRRRLRSAALFAAACVPGCAAVAVLQSAFYGSPFSSGYGSLDTMFALDRIGPNAWLYGRWFLTTHTPVMLLALVAPFALDGTAGDDTTLSRRAIAWLLLAFAAVNVALYLPYLVFGIHEWQYVRFLLPSIPLIIVLVVAVVDAVASRAASKGAALVTGACALALSLWMVSVARDRQAFRLDRVDARYARAGEYVALRLPANALVVTGWHGGSVRFHSGRPTFAWGELPPEWLDRALAFVRDEGLEPYLMLESWEEPLFRKQFRGTAIGELDWPPIADITGGVRVYRPDDRARFHAGAQVRTEYVR